MPKLWKDSFLGTSFIFFMIFLIYNVSALGVFNLFDPIGDALSDMQFTDVVFSRLREVPKADTNVVLVNIGYLGRRELAQEINLVASYHPKVIGVDALFSGPKPDTVGDMLLAQAIKNASDSSNIVLVNKLAYNDSTGQYDSIGHYYPLFSKNATKNAYANLPTDNYARQQEQTKMTRTFTPRVYLKGNKKDEKIAFSVQVAKIFDPKVTQEFLDRNRKTEVINFRGNYMSSGYQGRTQAQFFALDIEDLFSGNFEPSVLRNKIVMMGFMGNNIHSKSQDWGDMFYTPMNPSYAGKSNPDMYGVVIHANIVSMILHKSYINVLPPWLEHSIGIIIVYFNIAFFTIIYRKLSRWYDGLTKMMQLIELLLFTIIIIMFFNKFDLKLNLTLAFAGIALAGDGL